MQKKELDVIVVGELNVDLILNQIQGFPELGTEKLAGDLTLVMGSSSAICACNLSSLGASAGFIGKIGKDSFGRLVLDSLLEKNVNTDFIIVDEKLVTGVTVALNYDEERAMVTHQGAMTDLSIGDIKDEQLARARHLHFSSFFLQPGIAKDLHLLMKRAKELGLTTSLDTQWDPDERWDIDLKKILPWVDVFLPNEVELLHISGKEDWTTAIQELNQFDTTIVVKLGSKGSAFMENGQVIEVPSFKNDQVIDAIGAGDSFNAGFIRNFIEGASTRECARFGNLTGALSTTGSGGTAAFSNPVELKRTARDKFDVDLSNLVKIIG